jgi:RNA polymerase sigma-70 factor (ECF subfamily)
MDELVEKAKAGDKSAEAEIYKYLFVRFKFLAKRRMRSDDYEDLAQEACMTVLEKYKTQEFEISFTAWAYGVLRMKIGNWLQAQKRPSGQTESLDEAYSMAADPEIDPDLKRFLIECIKIIAGSYNRYARVMVLNYQGYSSGEVCERLKISINNYYVVMNRGRAMLRDCLSSKGAI